MGQFQRGRASASIEGERPDQTGSIVWLSWLLSSPTL